MSDWKKIETTPTWNYQEEGKDAEFVGVYRGKQEGVGPNESTLYDFVTKDGVVSIWGNSLLDSRFKNLEDKEEVKVVYLGKERSEKTGRTYHNFDVYHRMSEFGKVDDVDVDAVMEDMDS